jgi:hypothetical protein
MPSQFCDRDSWQARTIPDVPSDDAARGAWLLEQFKRRNEDVADRYRNQLIELYGNDRGRAIRYAEAFELSQYGRQASAEELKALFLV